MTAALPLGLLCGLAFGSAALSFLLLARVRTLAATADKRGSAHTGQLGASVEAVEKAVESLSEELREIREFRQQPSIGGIPKSGLNLSKRAQALRMHRRGDPPEQIASALAVSRQEVELLLKVHRIVMNRCGTSGPTAAAS